MSRRVRMAMRSGVVAVALAVLCTASSDAIGQTADYDVGSQRWNGLSQFQTLGDDLGTPITPHESLDYGELDSRDSLIIVYPRKELDIRSLSEFVIDGGHVLFADDFGRGTSFLERLDIRQIRNPEGGLPHNRFVRDNPRLPIFEPTGVHPLLEGVNAVVGNHPTVLHHRGGPVIPYADGGGFVYDMNLGEGKVVVFADASLLINHMLKMADNRRLVENALQYVCEGRAGCHPQLYAGAFEQRGAYRSGGDAERSVAWFAERFNSMVASAQQQIPSRPLLFYLALILTGGLMLYLATVFSVRESRRYSEYIDDAIQEVPAPQSEFEWNVSRFGADRRETNFALPLAILKEIFEDILYEELDAWGESPDDRPSVVELARDIRRQYLQDRPPAERDRLEEKVRDLLATYSNIPTRHRVFLDSDAYFSDRDLIQLYRRTMEVLELMGLEEEYERRTRTLV